MAKATINKTATAPLTPGVDWDKVELPVSVPTKQNYGGTHALIVSREDRATSRGTEAYYTFYTQHAMTRDGVLECGVNNYLDLSGLPQKQAPKPEVTGVTLELSVEEAAAIFVAAGSCDNSVYAGGAALGNRNVAAGIYSAMAAAAKGSYDTGGFGVGRLERSAKSARDKLLAA